ncbi:MAG: hypothetical protein IKM88_18305 [Lachnospiraceae bacterium]|nr:hypothetical protein [Lachnospiraceae bacterium]
MAVSSMSESQKQMLVKLRRRLEMNPQVMVYEEKARFYRALETLEDSQEPDAVSVAQDPAALQVLLASLRMLVIRLGKHHGLYQDVLDALRSIAPEMAGETERIAEQEEQQRIREVEQSVKTAQERFGERFPWLMEQLTTAPKETDGQNEMKADRHFVSYVFDHLLTAIDREELNVYVQKKMEKALTHEEVSDSRNRFRERAESRVQEEFQKEKPDEVFTRRMNACAEILKMGWNPDDMEMVDTFLSVLDRVPFKKKVREQGEAVLAELLTTKVDSWEQRQILTDKMSHYCEVAGRELYPEGNADSAFLEAVEKLLKFASGIISEAEYPEDPQFQARDAKRDEKEIAKVSRSAVDYVLGAQDYEGLERKRRQSIASKATLPKKQAPVLQKEQEPVICDPMVPEDTDLSGRGKKHLILDLSAGIKKKEGYLDAATGEYYDADELSGLPRGIYFAEENFLFRISSLSQLDDLLEHVPFDAGTGKVRMADRLRKSAKQYFVDQPLEIAYRDSNERDQVVAYMLRAQEMLLASDSDKYGMKELQAGIREYRTAKQKGGDAEEIAKQEAQLILQLRKYMEAVPERIGRTTTKNLEYACDLLCGLQREKNFKKNRQQYEENEEKEKGDRETEMNACIRIQSMLGSNKDILEGMLIPAKKIGQIREYATDAYVRMHRALMECTALDESKYSIREMNNAYMELRRAATAFAIERGWNSMDAIARAGSDTEKQMISTVQKLSRMAKNMSDNLVDASGKIRDKTTPMQTMMYRMLDEYEEEMMRKEQKKKEAEMQRETEQKEKTKSAPVLKK